MRQRLLKLDLAHKSVLRAKRLLLPAPRCVLKLLRKLAGTREVPIVNLSSIELMKRKAISIYEVTIHVDGPWKQWKDKGLDLGASSFEMPRLTPDFRETSRTIELTN